MPQNAIFQRTHDLLISKKQKTKKKKQLCIRFPRYCFAFATVVAVVLLRNSSSIVIHIVKRRLLRNRPGSDTATSRDFLRERLQLLQLLNNKRPLCLPSFVSFPSTNHLVVSVDQNQNRTVTFASPASVCPLSSPNTASLPLADTGHLYRQQTAS